MKELEKLYKEYKTLKKKEIEGQQKKKLKREIWKMKHRGIRKTANIIEGTAMGIGKIFKWGSKKTIQAGKNYDTNQNKREIREVKKEEDFLNIIK